MCGYLVCYCSLKHVFWRGTYLHHFVSVCGCVGQAPSDPNRKRMRFASQVRVAFEEFSGHAGQMLLRLEEMQETVARKDFPQDLEGARRMIEEHATLKKKVIKAPIEELDTEGQRYMNTTTCRVLHCYHLSHTHITCWYRFDHIK